MTARRREIELTVERPFGPDTSSSGTVRLSTRFDVGPDGEGPSHAELAKELDSLKADLDALVGAPIAAAPIARGERELTELVETYRPRQRELVDLLLADGEITAGEHRRLSEYVSLRPKEPAEGSSAAPELRVTDSPLAAVPIAASRPSESIRPVPELLATYQISSLRQAGAVRARRQISFAEYMALKRHFEQGGNSAEKPVK
ncbi:MAG TPA: hypothetical protein VEK13_01065 [Thermoplasmata archaeon]|nr:hypothetical protein [Thermoplasmata archaeon]